MDYALRSRKTARPNGSGPAKRILRLGRAHRYAQHIQEQANYNPDRNRSREDMLSHGHGLALEEQIDTTTRKTQKAHTRQHAQIDGPHARDGKPS